MQNIRPGVIMYQVVQCIGMRILINTFISFAGKESYRQNEKQNQIEDLFHKAIFSKTPNLMIYPIKNLIFPHFIFPDGELHDFLKKLD
jgi:hypothetical protein